ncbi:aquaporin [Trametes coccinea BRFM310]|uniref:Aquaporin n=1 Tax=Trametes coccinea (strain BRFM310) TaxID=1353009 RepID=A0A1Y2J3N2_TRAC3|nr:aquaporin [Trametes coccinea BRFM310]
MSWSKRRTLTSSDGSRHSKEERDTEQIEDIAPPAPGMTLDDLTEHYTKYPNRWSKYREILREPAAEFFGVMILIIFGAGVDCQVILSRNTKVAAVPFGDYLSLNFGWAVGTALGVWVSGGISGGHINPAVTIAMATFRDFPWRKVPMYIFAQVMGGLCGAGIIYANYIHPIDLVEGGRHIRTVPGTASLFSTYAADYMTSVSCWFDEFLGTAVLLIVVCAISDARNGPPPAGLAPLVLFIMILGIGAALGMQTGYAINPARDLGPRLLTAMVGYGGAVFSFRNQYWLWCPVIAPIVGALVGTFIYDLFFFTGNESLLNRPNATARAHHERARNEERQRPPAGFTAAEDIV